MEREINIVLKVNDDIHAKIIKNDILCAIKNRTTIWYITDPYQPVIDINTLYKMKNKKDLKK